MKVLSPETCRTLYVFVFGESGRGRLILNLPLVVRGVWSHLDLVSLCFSCFLCSPRHCHFTCAPFFPFTPLHTFSSPSLLLSFKSLIKKLSWCPLGCQSTCVSVCTVILPAVWADEPDHPSPSSELPPPPGFSSSLMRRVPAGQCWRLFHLWLPEVPLACTDNNHTFC